MFFTKIIYKLQELWKKYFNSEPEPEIQEFSAGEIKKAMYDIKEDDSGDSASVYHQYPYNDFY